MSIADVIADEWRLPRAPLAEVAARALNHRTGELIAQTIDPLDVNREHTVAWPSCIGSSPGVAAVRWP